MHTNFKQKCIFFIDILLLFLIFGCGGTSSPTDLPATGNNANFDYGHIQGTVIASMTGKIIVGAVVETFQAQAITDADGCYLLGPLPAGDYQLVARATGYSPIVKNGVRVYPGKITENQNFALSPLATTYDPDHSQTK